MNKQHKTISITSFLDAINKLTNNVVEYGGTIRQFVGPRKPSLMTANKEFLEFLCNNSKYLSKAKFYRYMKPWLGEGLITSDGESSVFMYRVAK